MDHQRVSSFEQLKVWQEAHALVLLVFAQTPNLPAEQQEGLALSMERSAVEVPKNIAEGFKRRGSRNKSHYYNLAQSALESLRYFFILCRDLKFNIDFDDLSYRGDQVSRMLDGLMRSVAREDGGRDCGGRRGRGGRGRGRGREEANVGEAPDHDSDFDRDLDADFDAGDDSVNE